MSKECALILGVSSGIGEACARELAKNGVDIIGLYMRKSKDTINSLADDICSHGVKAHMIKMNACNYEKMNEFLMGDIFSNYKIQVLVHSLAFGSMKPFIADNSSDAINKKNIEMTLDVMSNSLIYWVQSAYNKNLFKKGSQIIAMTSAGARKQWLSYGAVSMAKAALESAVRQLAVELAPYKIAANSIQAGVTDTDALHKIPGSEEMINDATSGNPNQRLTLPEDVSKAVVNIGLSSDTWMTGNTIRLDGGEDIFG